MNAEKIILDADDRFRVVSVDRQRECIIIYVESIQAQCLCPNCCLPASSVHSYYTRRFSDLPAFGSPCMLFLKARKFRCRTDECPVKIFTERFREHFCPYRRKTDRLEKSQYNLAIQNGGRPGERLCNLLSIPTSDNTLLRLICRADARIAFTDIPVDTQSQLPVWGVVACLVTDRYKIKHPITGKEVKAAKISTRAHWNMSTIKSLNEFEVFDDMVMG